MIKRLAHINIGTNDLEEAEHFYCEVLGLEKGFEFLKDGELYGFYVKTGDNTYIEIFIQGEAANLERPLLKHICLEVDDIDAAIETVRNRAWEITDKKFGGDKAWQAWITDPSGVRIELMQYTANSSQFTGEPCIVDW